MTYVICFVTAGSRGEALRIGEALVQGRLAACANVLDPVESAYWWRGKIEKAREALLVLKTREELVKRLTSRVREMHSYEVPEVIAVPIVGGNPGYLRWIDESVKPPRTAGSEPRE